MIVEVAELLNINFLFHKVPSGVVEAIFHGVFLREDFPCACITFVSLTHINGLSFAAGACIDGFVLDGGMAGDS